MGGGAAAAEEDGQKACQRTSGNTGGADTQRVAQGEGQRTLRYEGKAHDRSLGHAAALRGCESCREQHTGQRQPQRRDHAARHDGSHKIILQIDQCQCTGDIGGFIDRSAVVGGHHAAQKRAQQQAAAALHLGQAERHPPVEAAQRRIDDHKHQPADEQKTACGDEQPGLYVAQLLRYPVEQTVQQQHDQTGGKAADQCPPEAA